ncbi:uncharacterized protein LOC116291945, partial [Actinia tenebrosa]|uniref:Uncharacterized protein LOC116291945 n=1 Tax=Actinia tenebrosa TaxID=6105 RepID=A0A6P8HQT6_ACTTE
HPLTIYAVLKDVQKNTEELKEMEELKEGLNFQVKTVEEPKKENKELKVKVTELKNLDVCTTNLKTAQNNEHDLYIWCVGGDVEEDDIDIEHRLRFKIKGITPIIVRFKSHNIKTAFN